MGIDRVKQGELRTNIGAILGKSLRFLGYVRDCAKDDCPLKGICPFKPKGKCTVEYNFLKSLYNDWTDPHDGIGDELNQIQLDRVGTLLVPLYHQLIQINTARAGLNGKTSYEDSKGKIYIYPHFKEEREIRKAISDEIKEIGLEAIWQKKFGDKRPFPVRQGSMGELEEIMDQGRPGAYEEMERRAGIRDSEEGDG